MGMQDDRSEGVRHFDLRLPVSLHNELMAIKKETGDSVNAQIVSLVDRATRKRRLRAVPDEAA